MGLAKVILVFHVHQIDIGHYFMFTNYLGGGKEVASTVQVNDFVIYSCYSLASLGE